MTPARFRQRLRTHGPALERWPDAEEARQLLAASALSRRRFLAALADDPTLDAPVDPDILARLAEATRTGVTLAPRAVEPSWPGIVPLQWSALAACALLGVWLGTPGRELAAPPAPTVLASLQITALDPPWPDNGR